jgi:hypothetical protein
MSGRFSGLKGDSPWPGNGSRISFAREGYEAVFVDGYRRHPASHCGAIVGQDKSSMVSIPVSSPRSVSPVVVSGSAAASFT